MADYLQYSVGNFKCWISQYIPETNTNEVIVKGDDYREALYHYMDMFINNHPELRDINNYTSPQMNINPQFATFSANVPYSKYPVFDEDLNHPDVQNMIFDDGEWIYNNHPVKIVGFASMGVDNSTSIKVVYLGAVLYIYNGTQWMSFGIPYSNGTTSYRDTFENTIIDFLNGAYRQWGYYVFGYDLYWPPTDTALRFCTCLVRSDGSYFASRYTSSNRIAAGAIFGSGGTPNVAGLSITNPTTIPPNIDVSIEKIDPNNPYQPGGTSSTGGGKGTFDDTSDPVDFAPLPTLTAINSGFVGLYAPTLSQLQGLSNYLWNESFNLDQLKKLFADPMDLLISLTIVPLSPPITVQENIKVGFISTGLPMNKVEQQFITYDFGSLEIKPYFDSALDYSPYTKISIYLPYIGQRQLNVDEIMGKTIHLQYNIDLFTGSCVAEIKVANSVLYTFNGNLASSIPLTAGNFSNFLSATMNVAATIGLAVATGGATGVTSIASSAANLITSAKPNIEHAGSISSTTGYLSNKRPYLVYEIPNQSIPDSYQNYVGFPSNITSKLSDLTGYTEIESIHLENIPATMNELTEIESLLKQGVIL